MTQWLLQELLEEGLPSREMNWGGASLAAPVGIRLDLTAPQSLHAPLLVALRYMASSSLP